MKIKNSNDMFVDLIKDLYSAENQLIKALPKLAKKITDEKLRKGFEAHLETTVLQKERLEQLAELMEFSPKGKKCTAMEGLIKEAEETIAELEAPELIDAMLLMAAQKVEHYEIACYGSACTFAKMMGNNKGLKLLLQTLEEEKGQDEALTGIAETVINAKAIEA